MSSIVTHENEWPWGQTVTLICDNGAGTVDLSFEKNNPGVCYLSGLSVIPALRKKGLAYKLMLEAQNYCIRKHIFRIDLNSVQEDWLMKFYHCLGFTDIEENEGYMRMYKFL